jgi:RNA polymerase sigma-70 factor, ECF subfamily
MKRSDQELVETVLKGDRSGFEVLYDRYAPLIRAICRDSTGNLSDAQDLAQEAFLRSYQRLPTLRKPDYFGGWLVGIARRVCKEWRRRQANDPHRYVGPQVDEIVQSVTTGNENDTLDHLGQAIAQLPEKERMAVYVFYLQQHPVEQARALLGLSRSGFYRVLERARKRLALAINTQKETIR